MSAPQRNTLGKCATNKEKDAVGAGASNTGSSRSGQLPMLSGQGSPIIPHSIARPDAQFGASSPSPSSHEDKCGWIYDEYVPCYPRPSMKSKEVWSGRVKGPYDPNFKSERPPLTAGMHGFIATTFKENTCVLACYEILNHYYNLTHNIHPRTHKNMKVFTSVDPGMGKDVENFVFISTKLPNPNALCYKIYEDMLQPERQEERKYAIQIHTLFPIKHTMQVKTRNEISVKMLPIIENFLAREKDLETFRLEVNCHRDNPYFTSSEVDATVSGLIKRAKNSIVRIPAGAVATFSVVVLKDILCLGILREFEKYNEFNLYRSSLSLAAPGIEESQTHNEIQETLHASDFITGAASEPNHCLVHETTSRTPHEMPAHPPSDTNEVRDTSSTPGGTSHEKDINGPANGEADRNYEVSLTQAIINDNDSLSEPPATTQTLEVNAPTSTDGNDDQDNSLNNCCCAIV